MSERIKKTIVFIGYQPLTKKTSQDFFMDDLLYEGFDVRYWDLTSIFFGKITLNSDVNFEWIRVINTYEQFCLYLSKMDHTKTLYFVNFPYYDGRTVKIFKFLNRSDIKLCIIARGMIPLPSFKNKLSIIYLIKKISFNYVKTFCLKKLALLYKQLGMVKKFDVVFYGGEKSISIAGLEYQNESITTKLISINSSDYDKAILIQKSERITSNKYAVFLDEYLPFHPDFLMFNIKTIDAEKYYYELNNFFTRLEHKYKIDILVAAHPKAKLYSKRNYFNGRQVIFDKTAELVKDSEFVIAHMSTSISYSIIFKKPLLFIYSSDIKNIMSNQFEIISNFARTLDSQLVSFDFPADSPININEINIELYDKYKYLYLTTQQNEIESSSRVFIDSLICL
jgi:hypothetical protein